MEIDRTDKDIRWFNLQLACNKVKIEKPRPYVKAYDFKTNYLLMLQIIKKHEAKGGIKKHNPEMNNLIEKYKLCEKEEIIKTKNNDIIKKKILTEAKSTSYSYDLTTVFFNNIHQDNINDITKEILNVGKSNNKSSMYHSANRKVLDDINDSILEFDDGNNTGNIKKFIYKVLNYKKNNNDAVETNNNLSGLNISFNNMSSYNISQIKTNNVSNITDIFSTFVKSVSSKKNEDYIKILENIIKIGAIRKDPLNDIINNSISILENKFKKLLMESVTCNKIFNYNIKLSCENKDFLDKILNFIYTYVFNSELFENPHLLKYKNEFENGINIYAVILIAFRCGDKSLIQEILENYECNYDSYPTFKFYFESYLLGNHKRINIKYNDYDVIKSDIFLESLANIICVNDDFQVLSLFNDNYYDHLWLMLRRSFLYNDDVLNNKIKKGLLEIEDFNNEHFDLISSNNSLEDLLLLSLDFKSYLNYLKNTKKYNIIEIIIVFIFMNESGLFDIKNKYYDNIELSLNNCEVFDKLKYYIGCDFKKCYYDDIYNIVTNHLNIIFSEKIQFLYLVNDKQLFLDYCYNLLSDMLIITEYFDNTIISNNGQNYLKKILSMADLNIIYKRIIDHYGDSIEKEHLINIYFFLEDTYNFMTLSKYELIASIYNNGNCYEDKIVRKYEYIKSYKPDFLTTYTNYEEENSLLLFLIWVYKYTTDYYIKRTLKIINNDLNKDILKIQNMQDNINKQICVMGYYKYNLLLKDMATAIKNDSKAKPYNSSTDIIYQQKIQSIDKNIHTLSKYQINDNKLNKLYNKIKPLI